MTSEIEITFMRHGRSRAEDENVYEGWAVYGRRRAPIPETILPQPLPALLRERGERSGLTLPDSPSNEENRPARPW
jgi:hypothetical protein